MNYFKFPILDLTHVVVIRCYADGSMVSDGVKIGEWKYSEAYRAPVWRVNSNLQWLPMNPQADREYAAFVAREIVS